MKTLKRISAVVLVSLIFLSSVASAQGSTVEITNNIEPLRFDVSYNKTTNLIFPYAIKSVDKGSKDLMVQKAKGVENVLQLKAAKEDFEPTNLTVITGEGLMYSFLLRFNPFPSLLNIQLGIRSAIPAPGMIFSQIKDNETITNDLAERVAAKRHTVSRINDFKYDIGLHLVGIYIRENVLYFQVDLENNSNIDYDIDQFRMFVSDKVKSKRTSSQEVEIEPLSVTGNAKVIRGQSQQTVVFSLPKLTIPEKKYMVIQLMELNGGRNLQLKVQNKDLIKARGI